MLSGRSLSRQIAVSTLYSLDFNNQLNEEVDLSIFPGMSEEEMKALNEDEVIFARYLITGVLENLKDTHPTIIIDQAVKLSQSLSNDVSYKFINGILDTFVKDFA